MDPATSLQQRAVDYAKRGDFGPDALQVNRELTEIVPTNLGAWTRLARCCMEMGQLEEATVAIDAALQLDPQNTIARNLQGDVARKRTPIVATPRRRVTSSPSAPRSVKRATASSAGFGRPEFTALAHLPPAQALDAIGPRIEALLMELNERPFADRVVDARNRAGRSGSRLFRRNSFHAGGPGHVFACQHGGRWEPQLNLGWYSSGPARTMRAGIGFNLTADPADSESEVGRERILAQFARFQQLIASEWRVLLTRWMDGNRGFIQYGADPPATGLLPSQAVQWMIDCHNAADLGWVFCGRWLFADRADDEATLGDGRKLADWIDHAFTDLLPLWAAVYRG
jgi:tetratricopeptide (TPR) repeat protein